MKFLCLLLMAVPTAGLSPTTKTYYQHTQAAEAAIVDGKWADAQKSYALAFKEQVEPFAKDLMNASLVSSQLGSFTGVDHMLEKLIQRGVDIVSLRQRQGLGRYFESPEGVKFLERAGNLKPTIDIRYYKELELLFEKDQQFRGGVNNSPEVNDAIRKNAREVIDRFMKLVGDKGFPTESKIGVNPETLLPPFYPILFVHQGAGDMQQFNMGEFLRAQIDSGNINNDLAADLINRMDGRYSLTYGLQRIVLVKVIDTTRNPSNPANHVVLDSSAFGYFSLTSQELVGMNQHRKGLYQEDYEMSVRKAVFHLNHPDFIFGGHMQGASMILTDREDFVRMSGLLKR